MSAAPADEAFGDGDATATILAAGLRLRYSPEASARAALVYHRLREAEPATDPETLACTALFLTGKAAEAPRRVRDVVNAVHARDAAAGAGTKRRGAFKMQLLCAQREAGVFLKL